MENAVPTSYPADGRGINYYSLQGAVVRISAEAEKNYEIYADEGMLARVVSVTDDSHGKDRMVKVELDFSDFYDHNKRFQKANFFDKNGRATLTWYESGLYNNGRDTVYCMEDTEKCLPPFVPVDEIPVTVEDCLDVLKMVWEAGSIIVNNPPNEGWTTEQFKAKFSAAERKARTLLRNTNRI